MLSFNARSASRQEMYRDLVYATAELVSRNLPVGELLERAVELGKAFFHASSLEIRLRGAGSAEGTNGPLGLGVRLGVDEAVAEVLRSGTAIVAPDASAMHVPIRFGGIVRGVISIVGFAGSCFDELDASLFEKWALLLSVRINELHLSAANARLEVLAGVDALTGIYNRRAFGELLAQAWARCTAGGTSFAVAMIDVDLFKSFNEKYGHVGGDACLKQIAKSISTSLRSGDVLGRYGGEEFSVFFEATSLAAAIEVSERLRANISALGIPHIGSRLGHVTASAGVAAAAARAGEDPLSLLERADAALYGAKARGRNRVVAEAYVSESSAALPQAEVRGNLPTPVSSFCGRHNDVQRVRSALDESRLVTVVGFGGIGKTRLSLEVANELAAGFRDGAWFVDLSGTHDGNVIAGLVASALELRDPAAATSVLALTDVCRNKEFLLVLDNCEHLLADCAAFAATLLRATPNIRILATSREPLDLGEELVVGLAPFVVPEGATLSARDASSVSAVQLFVDRARAVTAFELDDDNVGAVLDLCRRVDGIALGIELAAARLKMLSLEQLRTKLDGRFGLLARKGGVARQQTLWALIDWSFTLLSPQERRLFARLGIFAGSFTLEAATAVCPHEDADRSVLDGLEALVDKSLLVVETRSDDRRTFRFFESIRSYARERLTADGELDVVEACHRDYYLAVAAAAEAARPGRDWLEALRPLEYASDDLRAILESTLGARRHQAAGAQLAANLIDYWNRHHMAREGRAWLECALTCEDAAFRPDLRARIRLALLELLAIGEAHAGLELGLQAAEVIGKDGDDRLAAQASFQLGKLCADLSDTEGANEHLQAAQRKAEICADARTLAQVMTAQGSLALFRGDCAGGITMFTRSAQLFQRINREYKAVIPLGNLAEVYYIQGRPQDAIDRAKRALAICERNGEPVETAWLLCNLGNYYLTLGDEDSAASFTRDALPIALDVGDEWQVLCCIETYARISHARGETEIAALLVGYAAGRLATINLSRQPFEQQLMADFTRDLRAALGPERFEGCLTEGGSLSREATLALIYSRSSKAVPEARLAS
jgi:non-specific serine/threonine protein kinase